METERIKRALQEAYDIGLVRLEPVGGGLDTFAKAYRLSADDGRDYFVKQRQAIDPGVGLSSALADLGIEAILAPLKTKVGEVAFDDGESKLLVYPFIDAENGFRNPPGRGHWEQLGTALRKIHDAQLSEEVLRKISRESFRVDGIPEFENTLDRLLSGVTHNDAEADLTSFMQEKELDIRRCIERVQILGDECRNGEWNLVPCHADLHVGNILVDGPRIHVIDWDSPRLAPRECDLMFIDGGGITALHDAEDERYFLNGYGEVDMDPLAMTYYRYIRAVEDFVSFVRDATTSDFGDLEERMEHVRGFKVVFGEGQIVETAFKSDAALL